MEHIIAKEYDYCLLVVKGGRAGSVSVTEKGHFCRHRDRTGRGVREWVSRNVHR